MRKFSAFARDQWGQSLVEFSLLMPITIMLILAGGDMSRGYAIQIAIQNGARAGAEAAAIDYTPTIAATEARARDEMSRTPGMDGQVPAIDVRFHNGDNVHGSCVANPPTPTNPCFATVRVMMPWRTITAWPLIPNTFNFDRATTMRMLAKG